MFVGVLLGSKLGLPREGAGVALPLLATQILWINLVTDGAPALALGVDPADEGLMRNPPRPPNEGVITARMWRGIFFVGAVIAASTLLVLDASLPGGLIEGTGTLVYGQTMAFTTLMLSQLFNVFNARSDEKSAFIHLFTNRWLWLSIAFSLALQCVVLYLPAMQRAFGTVGLGVVDWGRCAVAASAVFWLREGSKIVTRMRDQKDGRLASVRR
jgi:Ca2+-transporting ATPase